jgi:hypothetical protein
LAAGGVASAVMSTAFLLCSLSRRRSFSDWPLVCAAAWWGRKNKQGKRRTDAIFNRALRFCIITKIKMETVRGKIAPCVALGPAASESR